MIRTLHVGLADGIKPPLTKLCARFGVPRRTVHHRPTMAAQKVDRRFAAPVKAAIEKEPSFGCQTVAWLLGLDKNTVESIIQIKEHAPVWPCGAASRTCRLSPPRPTSAGRRTSAGSGRVAMAGRLWKLIRKTVQGTVFWSSSLIDCHSRELLGGQLSRSGKSTMAASALEHAQIKRFRTLGKVTREDLLRSNNFVRHRARTGDASMAQPPAEQHDHTHIPHDHGARNPSPALEQKPGHATRRHQ